jgi:glycosyltransferase involved in cell wall biosynthesis
MEISMKITLEAQHAVGTPQPRGIGHYSIDLIQNLLRRNVFDYEITFFDYGHEMGNLNRAQKLFGAYGVPLHECSELDYRVATRNESVFVSKNYNEYTNTCGDIYHFMHIVTLPTRMAGKMLVTVHDLNWLFFPEALSDHSRPLFDEGLRRLNLWKPDVIADSNSAKHELLRFSSIPKEHIHVVYPAFDATHLYQDVTGEAMPGIEKNTYFFYVGSLEKKKNLVHMIQAFSRVAPKFEGLRFVIAGKATWEDPAEIMEAVAHSGVSERIIFPGYIDVDTKRKLYSNALCFLQPSLCEGFGLPILEAMVCGCPVITSNTTSMPEAAGDAGILVDPYNVEQLAYEMERVVSSETLCKEMIQKGFAQAAKFSWDKTAEQVENVYRLVMER